MRHLPISFALALICSSCNQMEVEKEDQAEVKIVGGRKVTKEDLEYLSTASIGGCTAFVVGKRIVLTAAHCVEEDQCVRTVRFGLYAHLPVASRNVVASIPHPNYRGSGHDIAMLILDKPVPAPFKPAKLVKAKSKLKIGLKVILAGYGHTAFEGGSSDILKRTITQIKKIHRSGKNDNGSYRVNEIHYYTDGDKPSAECFGDSGGPMYAKTKDGELYALGVTAHGLEKRDECVRSGAYTDVRPYIGWMNRMAKACTNNPDCEYNTCSSESRKGRRRRV